jgi:hypothetical protein
LMGFVGKVGTNQHLCILGCRVDGVLRHKVEQKVFAFFWRSRKNTVSEHTATFLGGSRQTDGAGSD